MPNNKYVKLKEGVEGWGNFIPTEHIVYTELLTRTVLRQHALPDLKQPSRNPAQTEVLSKLQCYMRLGGKKYQPSLLIILWLNIFSIPVAQFDSSEGSITSCW
jgi:hypothetical protein